MWLFLEVRSGDDSGQRFPLREGLKIGRTTGDILLKDSKLSSLHAQIEREKSGQLALVDRGSANGIVLNGTKVPRILLAPGVEFRMGRTFFRVSEGQAAEGDSFKDTDSGRPRQKWQSELSDEVGKLLAQNSSPRAMISPFLKALRLDFLEGPQADRSVVLGYGPRKFGSAVLDIEIQDSSCPFLAFEIMPEAGDSRFVTKEPGVVKLNNRSVMSELLKEGDLIRIGQTLIRVGFVK